MEVTMHSRQRAIRGLLLACLSAAALPAPAQETAQMNLVLFTDRAVFDGVNE
jgi:hypothetical protein